ncbi:MAG: hypothetical protein QM662_14745 [Gordonia sp. (in: high G+C Gram-positive bacteria)]
MSIIDYGAPPVPGGRALRRRVGALVMSFTVVLGAIATLGSGPAVAAPACPNPHQRTVAAEPVSRTVTALRQTCTQAQFDALFRRLPAGALPKNVVMNGQVRPIGAPNPAATAAASSIWAGKHFYNGWLTNRVLGGESISAAVRYGRSVIDGKPVVRIDYARSGAPFGHDELRALPNGVYLGYGFLDNTRQVDFWVWR